MNENPSPNNLVSSNFYLVLTTLLILTVVLVLNSFSSQVVMAQSISSQSYASIIWGDIVGDIANQEDLMAIVEDKVVKGDTIELDNSGLGVAISSGNLVIGDVS